MGSTYVVVENFSAGSGATGPTQECLSLPKKKDKWDKSSSKVPVISVDCKKPLAEM